jgi:hypothetical protein
MEMPGDEQPRNLVTWQDAELLAAGHMRTLGFTDAQLTGSGADGGIDVESRDAAAQVKFHATPTGAPEIQKLRGAAYDFSHQIFYSAGDYTPAAIAFAERAGVALFIIGPWSSIAAANAAAEKLVDNGMKEGGGPDSPLAFDVADPRTEVAARMESISTLFMQVGEGLLALPGSKQMAILDTLGPVDDRFRRAATRYLNEVNRGDGGRLRYLLEIVDEAGEALLAFSRLTGIDIEIDIEIDGSALAD